MKIFLKNKGVCFQIKGRETNLSAGNWLKKNGKRKFLKGGKKEKEKENGTLGMKKE